MYHCKAGKGEVIWNAEGFDARAVKWTQVDTKFWLGWQQIQECWGTSSSLLLHGTEALWMGGGWIRVMPCSSEGRKHNQGGKRIACQSQWLMNIRLLSGNMTKKKLILDSHDQVASEGWTLWDYHGVYAGPHRGLESVYEVCHLTICDSLAGAAQVTFDKDNHLWSSSLTTVTVLYGMPGSVTSNYSKEHASTWTPFLYRMDIHLIPWISAIFPQNWFHCILHAKVH